MSCIAAADFSYCYSYLILTKYVSLYLQEWYQISWEVFAQCLAINASKNKFKKWCQPSQENIQRSGVKCCRTILAANLGHYITFEFPTFDWKFWVIFVYSISILNVYVLPVRLCLFNLVLNQKYPNQNLWNKIFCN